MKLFLGILFLFSFFQNVLLSQGVTQSNPLEKKLLEFLSPENEKEIKEAKFQLITVSPSLTVTTAFGHSAIRVLYGKPFDEKDFYIDFGEYDETVSFIWRFLKGEAKFFVKIHNMGESYQVWDTTGRGMVSSEFKLTPEQKLAFAKAIRDTMEAKKLGYQYHNFTSNCVTFIRDIVGNVYGKPLELETEVTKATWRKRLEPYALKIFWLRFQEKLLLDHETDLVRNPTELIYLPFDLLIALEDAKLVKEQELLHRDLWKLPDGFDTLGFFVFGIFVFLVASQLPGYLSQRFGRSGEILFGVISVVSGTFTLVVLLFTSFSFMDETIMVLVFTPIDVYLLSSKLQSRVKDIYFAYLRIGMLALVVLLRFSIFPQNIDASLFFTILFFVFYFIKIKKQRQILSETG